jgi:hypothetical protein
VLALAYRVQWRPPAALLYCTNTAYHTQECAQLRQSKEADSAGTLIRPGFVNMLCSRKSLL